MLEAGLAVLDAKKRSREAVHDPAHTGIGGERREERLRGDDLLRRLVQIFDGQEQQTVLREERIALDVANDGKLHGAGNKRFLKRRSGLLRAFGRHPVDHHDGQIVSLREGSIEFRLMLTPGNLRGDQVLGIAVHFEIL